MSHDIFSAFTSEELQSALSSKLFRGMLDTIPIAVAVLEAERDSRGIISHFSYRFANKTAERMAATPLQGKRLFLNDDGLLFNTMAEVVATGNREDFLYHFQGEPEKWTHYSISRFGLGVMLTYENVTERKKAALALQRERAQMAEAQEISNTGSFEWDLVAKKVYWSDEMYRIHSILPQSQEIDPESVCGFIHPDDAIRIRKKIENYSKIPGREEMLYKLKLQDGQVRHIRTRLESFRGKSGRITHISGMAQDVTERKQTEEELRTVNDLLRKHAAGRDKRQAALEDFGRIIGSVHDAIISIDTKGYIVTWNAGAERIYGFTSSEAVGRHIGRLIVPDDRQDALMEMLTKVLKNGESIVELVTTKKCKDKSLIEVTSNIVPLKDAFGKITGAAATSKNISEIRKANPQRKKMNELLELKNTFRSKAEITDKLGNLEGNSKDFLLQLNETLRAHLTDTAALQHAAMKLLAEHFNAAGSVYYDAEPEEDSFTLRANFAIGAVRIPAQIRLSDFSPTLAGEYRAGQTQMVFETENEPAADVYREIGIRAWLAVPIVKEGRLASVIGLHSTTPRSWTDGEAELLEIFAELTYAALDRTKIVESLRKSEEKYRTLLDTIDEGFCVIELIRDNKGKAVDFIYREINESFQRLTGFENPVGKRIGELMPEVEKYWIEAYAKVVDTGEPLRMENYLSATGRWYSVQASRVGGKEDNLAAVVFNDITQSKHSKEQAEQQISEQNKIIQSMTTATPDIMFVMDINTKKVLFATRNIAEEMGYTKEQIAEMKEPFLDIMHPEDRPALIEHVEQMKTAADSEVREIRYRIIHADGSIKWFIDRNTVFRRDENGVPYEKMGITHDINSRVDADEKIQMLNKSLWDKNRELRLLHNDLKTLTSVAAHDYKETLQTLYTNLEFVISRDAQNFSNTGKANLRKAQTAIQKMKLLTDDIVAFSKIKAPDENPSAVDLGETIGTVLDELSEKIAEASPEIKLDKLPVINGYPYLLELLFYHLIDNAIKFRNPDKKLEISITSHTSNDKHTGQPVYQISISDNGIGFEQQYANKIFDMFYRIHDKKYKGSGIGLPICKKIADLHGGTMAIESQPFEGTLVCCFFPMS